MSLIKLHLTALWKWLYSHLNVSFDLAGVRIEDDELEQQLGFGRE